MTTKPIIQAARLKARANERQVRQSADAYAREGQEAVANQQYVVANAWKAMLEVLNAASGDPIKVWPDRDKPLYVEVSKVGFDVRQTRYYELYAAGEEHPNDVIATGFTRAAILDMSKQFGWDLDTTKLIDSPKEVQEAQMLLQASASQTFMDNLQRAEELGNTWNSTMREAGFVVIVLPPELARGIDPQVLSAKLTLAAFEMQRERDDIRLAEKAACLNSDKEYSDAKPSIGQHPTGA